MQKDFFLHYDQTLDVTGLRCPMPIMKTKLKVRKLTNKEKLLIITTDPSFSIDCKVFAKQAGHNLLQSWHDGNKFYFILQKNNNK